MLEAPHPTKAFNPAMVQIVLPRLELVAVSVVERLLVLVIL